MSIVQLFRYPVKGLSGEALSTVSLEPNGGFPLDRKFALALPQTQFDEAAPQPQPKSKFLMLMKNESLAALTTRYDEQDDRLTICDRNGIALCEGVLSNDADKDRIEHFFLHYLSDDLDTQPRLVQAEGHQFTDVSVVSKSMMHAVSLINLASIRALEAATGKSIHPMRFRANVYFDNGQPWSEFDWIGKEIQLGSLVSKIVLRTRRCPATQVNPRTAVRDIDIPADLKEHFDHSDLGIYAEVQSTGTLSLGDAVEEKL